MEWKCPVCNVVVHSQNKEEHNSGKRHRDAQKGLSSTPWTCEVCALTTRLKNKESHLGGNRHRDAVRAAKAASTDRPPKASRSDIAQPVATAPPPNPSSEEKSERDGDTGDTQPLKASATSWMMCSDCGLMVPVKDKDSHIATHTAAAPEPTNVSVWTCDICALTLPENEKDKHLAEASHQSAARAQSVNASNVGVAAQLETAFRDATAAMARATAQSLLDLQAQLDAASRHRDITVNELASARKAWDEKEHGLLLKTDELRAKILSLETDLNATKAECTAERELRMAEVIRRVEIEQGLNAKLKEALDEKQRLTTALDRKVESILTGQSILSLARTKLSDVTSARDAILAQTATLTATVDTLRKENATQVSRIDALQQQLDLANMRWSSHGQEITDEQLIWKDEEEVEAEKRRQEEEIRQARERLDRMRREELEQAEAREKKRADDKRAREAEEEMKRRNEEEARRMAEEKLEHEKKQAYEHWKKCSAGEMLRHQSIFRTRFLSQGVWTDAKALYRFVELLGELPSLDFSAERPLTLWSLPWPVLANPVELAAEKIDWKATEAFFDHAKKVLSAEKYNEMVSRAQKIFHPDRWVGKLALVLDDGVRASLQKIINTVEQVINSLLTR